MSAFRVSLILVSCGWRAKIPRNALGMNSGQVLSSIIVSYLTEKWESSGGGCPSWKLSFIVAGNSFLAAARALVQTFGVATCIGLATAVQQQRDIMCMHHMI